MIIKEMIKKLVPAPVLKLILSCQYLFRKIPNNVIFIDNVKGKKGVEIGGPSSLFKTHLPIYPILGGLDGVNFSNRTLWEGDIKNGNTFNYYDEKFGFQYILDATDLHEIDTDHYDFLLSSNCLEHIANPLKALSEWIRVIKPSGIILLVLPNKKSNFDHKRPITKFQHILDDYYNKIGEDDLTHIEEILALHDLKKDPAAGNFNEFKLRSIENHKNRALHHHVFDMKLIQNLMEFQNLKIVATSETRDNYYVIGRK